MKTFKRYLLQLVIACSLLVGAQAVPVAAHHCFSHAGAGGSGGIAECVDAGACLNTTGADCPSEENNTSRLNNIVRLVINIFSVVVGVVAVIMIIIGGLKYITSSGDSSSVNSAKNTILYAIIGLVVVALAQIIVRFVLARTANAGG